MKRQSGFTLLELLITLMVVGVLMQVAIPSFRDFTVRNNSLARLNDLMLDLRFARNEAAKHGQTVRFCVGNSAGCQAGLGQEWEQGWATTLNGTTTVLRVAPALEGSDEIRSLDNSTAMSFVDFNRYGFATPRIFRLCDGLGDARAILLSRSGRARFATDTDSPPNGIVDDENNNDIACP